MIKRARQWNEILIRMLLWFGDPLRSMRKEKPKQNGNDSHKITLLWNEKCTFLFLRMYKINNWLNFPIGTTRKVASMSMWRWSTGMWRSINWIVGLEGKTQNENCFVVFWTAPSKNLCFFSKSAPSKSTVCSVLPYESNTSSFSKAAFICSIVSGVVGNVPFFINCKPRSILSRLSEAPWFLYEICITTHTLFLTSLSK